MALVFLHASLISDFQAFSTLRFLVYFRLVSYLFLFLKILLTIYLRCYTGETQTPKQFTDNYCIWSPHRSVE